MRESEYMQLIDTLQVSGLNVDNKSVLDVSGGPGYVGKKLSEICNKVVVTEYSEVAVKAMSEVLGIEAIKFDYNSDRLDDLLETKFDIILLRSSIIFCEHLEEFIKSLINILNPGGHVLVETILPTLGEILWWQQLEFKFTFIYSQETIEKYFYKNGFSLIYGQRDYESYFSVMRRQRKDVLSKLYTFMFEYPLVMLYYLLARKSRVPIETKLKHSMLTQVWCRDGAPSNYQTKSYKNYKIGANNHSKHFGMVYNGYLKRH
jgi:2-polyprenyl-3-methyl-5-hydroxy-6-metoxy-1,4-benzoquinol methylase